MDQLSFLMDIPLFAGIERNTLEELLVLLQPREKEFETGELLLLAGHPTEEIGIVLAGRAEASKTAGGSQFTVTRLAPGDIYGDVLSGSHTESPVTITALAPCRILLLSYPRLWSGPAQNTTAYTKLLQNLIRIISQKYFSLDARIDLLLTKGLRRRIASWLLYQADKTGSLRFSTGHTRASLAAYLGCERSALSRELSRMAKAGLIETKRGSFALLQPEKLRQAAADA